jgi:hypothetical protein
MSGPEKVLEFEARFISQYERELTPEEARYLSLAEVALEEPIKTGIHSVHQSKRMKSPRN